MRVTGMNESDCREGRCGESLRPDWEGKEGKERGISSTGVGRGNQKIENMTITIVVW